MNIGQVILPRPVETFDEPLSALEHRLHGPQARAARAESLAKLDELATQLRAAVGRGVSPGKFRELSALLDACQAAREVIEADATSHRQL